MPTKPYYECHITMQGDPARLKPLVERTKWRFSSIDGDIDLGIGVKCYATRQFNKRTPRDDMIATLNGVGLYLSEGGATVLRLKIEEVIYDNRSPQDECECHSCPTSALNTHTTR